MRPEGLGELLEVDWLGDIPVHPLGKAPLFIPCHRVGSHGDDGDIMVSYRGALVTDLCCCLEPVHLRHLNIHEYQIIGYRLESPRRFQSVSYCVGPTAELLDQLQRHELIRHVVLSEQDAGPVPLSLGDDLFCDCRTGLRRTTLGDTAVSGEQTTVEPRWLDWLGHVRDKAGRIEVDGVFLTSNGTHHD